MPAKRRSLPLPELISGTPDHALPRIATTAPSASPSSHANNLSHANHSSDDCDNGAKDGSALIAPRRLLRRQQLLAERAALRGHLSTSPPNGVSVSVPLSAAGGGPALLPLPTSSTSLAPSQQQQQQPSSTGAQHSSHAAPLLHTGPTATATTAAAAARLAVSGTRQRMPKEYADMGALKDLSPSLLYSALLGDEAVQRWCQPAPARAGVGSMPRDHRSAESTGGDMSQGRTVNTGLPSYGSSARASHVGAATANFSDDEDDVTESTAAREAMAERRIAKQKVAMLAATQDLFAAKNDFLRTTYEEGQRQQQLAREEVSAYGKELGEVEAVSQLLPFAKVEEVLTSIQADPVKSASIFGRVVEEDALLREMHMAILRTKLKYQVDSELESGHANLARACDVHLNSVGFAEGSS